MKRKSTALLIALLALPAALAGPPGEKKPSALESRARELVGLLARQDFAAVVKDFDDTMKKVLPAKKLADTWKGIVKQVGPFQKIVASQKSKAKEFDVVIVTCDFANLKLDARWVFDASGKVTGLFFRPAQTEVKYKAPAYVKRDAFRDVDVNIGDEWKLPGSLSVPAGAGPFPGVVLLQGSGPQDRNETIGPNQGFKDLAWGLASRGIAVLRFDKRSYVHGAKMKADEVTIEQDVTDDALAAIRWLRRQDKTKVSKVFVLGHSLGAMLAPRLAREEPALAGLIMLAAPARPLEDLILDQFAYLFSLDGEPSEEQKKELEKIRKQVERVRDPKLSPSTPKTELPLGAAASYWLSLRGPSPTEIAAKLKQPILVLQGERDYQVTMKDFRLWKKSLAGRDNATLKSYPSLNHLFIAGQGKSRPVDYQKPGHVADAVIDDIAGWIAGH